MYVCMCNHISMSLYMVKHVYTRSNTLDKKGQGTPNLTCGLADILGFK